MNSKAFHVEIRQTGDSKIMTIGKLGESVAVTIFFDNESQFTQLVNAIVDAHDKEEASNGK